jgi:hypothetical protein
MQASCDVLQLRAGLYQRAEHVWGKLSQNAPSPRKECVWLKEVRNATPILTEHRARVRTRNDFVALEHNRLVASARHGKRSRQSCDPSARHDELHSLPSVRVIGPRRLPTL